MKRKGQAALEFLSTYGFALLIILVMIGALWYFGVLNPARFLPERCLVGNEFTCEDFELTRVSATSATLNMFVSNNLGNTINFSNSDYDANLYMGAINSSWGSGYCNTVPTAGSDTLVVGGSGVEVNCTMTGSFPATGEKIKVQVDLLYKELGGRYQHPIKGEVFATLQ